MRGKIFRIGHLGHFNDLMLCGTLCGVEMGLHRAGIPHQKGGVAAALDYLGALNGGRIERRSHDPAADRPSGRRACRGRSGQPIAAIPDAARPQSEADSYAIQDAVMRRLGERAGGWKVGYSPEGGIFCAPIYASNVHASPASLPAAGFT